MKFTGKNLNMPSRRYFVTFTLLHSVLRGIIHKKLQIKQIYKRLLCEMLYHVYSETTVQTMK